MERKTIPAEKARQGRRGWQMLVVLVAALILAMAAWYASESLVGRNDQPAAAGSATSTN